MITIGDGTEDTIPRELTRFDGALYFRATTEAAGMEPYRLAPGSDTPTLIDISDGPASSMIFGSEFTAFHHKLYFAAADQAGNHHLYRLSPGCTTPVEIDLEAAQGSLAMGAPSL